MRFDELPPELRQMTDDVIARMARLCGREAAAAAGSDMADFLRDYSRELEEGIPPSEAIAVFQARVMARVAAMIDEEREVAE